MTPNPGVRTARKLLVVLGLGLAFITIFSVASLISLGQLNGIVRHLAFDPVPGAAAIAGMAKDFNEYRLLEATMRPGQIGDQPLAGKAADIERDLKAYDDTITQAEDRRQFGELVSLWTTYHDLHDDTAARNTSEPAERTAANRESREQAAKAIAALLPTMIEWNRLEGVRSIGKADSATRAASVTVLAMLIAALLLSALALHFNRTVERPMYALAETARSVARGQLDVRATEEGPLEVATVARELNAMLEARARADADARTLHEALAESREQLQQLADGLLLAREEERTRIAREMHDVLGQALTALKMDVAWLGRRLPDAPAIAPKLADMLTLIDDAVVTVRRMATDLRPGMLDDLGLAAAVEWEAQAFELRTGIRCALGAAVDDRTLDPLVSTALFRILQESLTNVARHSRAASVAVTLERQSTDFVLEVRDDGIGIAAADVSHVRSIGLTGMRERAQLAGGNCSISGKAGAGTTVHVRIPWRERATG